MLYVHSQTQRQPTLGRLQGTNKSGYLGSGGAIHIHIWHMNRTLSANAEQY